MNNDVSTRAFVKLFNHLYISPYFQLDAKIQSLYSPWGLDLVVCEGLQPELAARLASCAEFLTTTSTSTTQAPLQTRHYHSDCVIYIISMHYLHTI